MVGMHTLLAQSSLLFCHAVTHGVQVCVIGGGVLLGQDIPCLCSTAAV